MTLQDELAVIDQTLAELLGRRAEIVSTLEPTATPQDPKLIQFPEQHPRVEEYTYTGTGGRMW
jgi:hypothetical protein